MPKGYEQSQVLGSVITSAGYFWVQDTQTEPAGGVNVPLQGGQQ